MVHIQKTEINRRGECPICGSSDIVLWHQYRSDHILMRCRSCGLRFQSQRQNRSPEPQVRYNLQAYRELRAKIEWRTLSVAKARVDCLLKTGVNPEGRLFEIGSSGGEFLYMAQNAGFDVYGVEPSAGLVEYAKDRFKLENLKSGLFPKVTFEGKFDVVALHHVFEHIEGPFAFLKQVKAQLEPGGVLYMRMPNGDGFYLNLFSSRHSNFRQSDHFFFYTPHHLERMFESEGLEIIALSTYEDSNNLFTTLYYMIVPFLRRLSKKRLLHWLEAFMDPNIAYWMGKHTKWLQHFWVKSLCKRMKAAELVVIARWNG